MGLMQWVGPRAGPAMGVLLVCLNLVGTVRAVADTWSPGLTVAMRYDNPATGGSGSGGQWIAAAAPELFLERLGPLVTWNIRAHRRYDSQESARTPRMSHDVAAARVAGRFAEHSQVSLEGSYFRSRDLMHPDPESPLAPTESSVSSGSVVTTLWRGEASYQAKVRSYTSPELGDSDSQTWNAAIFPLRSEQHVWLVGWRRQDWTLSGHPDLSLSAGTLGFRRAHTPSVSSELQLGVAEVEDDLQGSRRRNLALIAGLNGLGHALSLPFDARLRVAHDVTTSGLVEAWRSVGGIHLTARWERSLEAEGGVFQEPTRRDFLSAEAQDTLSGRSVISVQGSYRRARPRTGPGTQIETYRAAASVTRDLRSWLTAGVRYSLARQTGAGDAGIPDFDRNRVELSFTAAYR